MSYDYKNLLGVTELELKGLRRRVAARSLLDAVASIAHQKRFGLGDILVRKYKGGAVGGKYETMSNSDVPQKYMVVHVDEAGLIYCKKIVAGGKLGKGLELLATYGIESSVFELDPDMTDHILLGAEDAYSPFEKAKALRKHMDKVKRYNESIRQSTKTMQEVMDFIGKLSPGTVMWSMYSNTDNNPTKFTIVEVTPYTPGHPHMSYSDTQLINAGFKTGFIVKADYLDYMKRTASRRLECYDFIRTSWFLEQPKTIKTEDGL